MTEEASNYKQLLNEAKHFEHHDLQSVDQPADLTSTIQYMECSSVTGINENVVCRLIILQYASDYFI